MTEEELIKLEDKAIKARDILEKLEKLKTFNTEFDFYFVKDRGAFYISFKDKENKTTKQYITNSTTIDFIIQAIEYGVAKHINEFQSELDLL